MAKRWQLELEASNILIKKQHNRSTGNAEGMKINANKKANCRFFKATSAFSV